MDAQPVRPILGGLGVQNQVARLCKACGLDKDRFLLKTQPIRSSGKALGPVEAINGDLGQQPHPLQACCIQLEQQALHCCAGLTRPLDSSIPTS